MCNLFSNTELEQPTIFPVYAHNNDIAGAAHEGCARDLIKWLQDIHAGILSDKSALPPLVSYEDDASPIRNILSNQIRLLPHVKGINGNITSTRIDKVIVFGSEVLENYCKTPYASAYIKTIIQLCLRNIDQSMEILKSQIQEVVDREATKDGFHHVLTEIAFLEVRRHRLSKTHSMVPVSLNGSHHLPYLSIFRETDLTLKLNSQTPSALHALFFRLLKQLFIGEKDLIKDLKGCYNEVVNELKLESLGRLQRNSFNDYLNTKMTNMYHRYWRIYSIAIRNGKHVAYAGRYGSYEFKVMEKVNEGE